MPEGLKIQVDAEVQQAIKKVRDLELEVSSTFGSIGTKIAASGKNFKGLEQNLANAGKSFKAVKTQVNIFDGSLEDLRARIGARQSFLNTEKDITKIKQLNKEISLLELQVTHLTSAGRTKFDQFGVAVTRSGAAARSASANINLTGLSLNNVGKGAQKALAGLLRVAYILPGLGVAGLIGGIATVAGALVGIGTSAEKTAVDFSYLAKGIEAANEKQKELTKAADTASGTLISQIKTLKDLRGIMEDATKSTDTLTAATINQGVARLVFSQKESELQKVLSAEIEREFLLRKRTSGLSAPEFIVDTDLENLKRMRATLIRVGESTFEIDKVIKRIEELNATIGSSRGSLRFLNVIGAEFKSLFTGFIDGDATKKEDKFITDTISRGKEIAAAFKKIFAIVPEFTIFDSVQQQFQKALSVIKNFNTAGFDFRIPFNVEVVAPPDEIKQAATTMAQLYGKEFNRYFEGGQFDPSIGKAISEELRQQKLAQALGLNKKESPFTQMERDAIFAADAITNSLSPAFQGLFDAILAGENPMKAFFTSLAQSVAQLIQKLIAAAIQAAILSALFPGGVGTAKGFGGFFKNILGFAAGGIVSGPTLALIGEGAGTSRSNPEVVAPLDQLRSMLAGIGGDNQRGGVMTSRVRGKDILLISNRSSRSQRRTTGR